jgi:hypothetical protein
MVDEVDVEEVPCGLDSCGRGATWTTPGLSRHLIDRHVCLSVTSVHLVCSISLMSIRYGISENI